MPLTAPTDLLSLNDMVSFLRLDGPVDTGLMTDFIGTAAEVAQFYCGDLLNTTYSEVHDGGDQSIWLRHTPVLSVTSLTEYIGSIVYTLTLQPPGSSVDAWGYSIDDPHNGKIVRRTASGQPFRFVPGVGNVAVTYTAGVNTAPSVVKQAMRIIVKELWETQRGSEPLPMDAGDGLVAVPGVGYGIPVEAVEILQSAERNVVFG